MRFGHKCFVFAALVLLAACGKPDAAKQPSAAEPAAAAAAGFRTYAGGQAQLLAENGNDGPPTTWFICDADNAQDVFVASAPEANGAFQLARYSKTTLQAERMNVTLGDPIDAPRGPARGFADAQGTFGVIYTLAAASMSGPNVATTAPVISLDLAGEEFNCAWIEHIRFIGFTGAASYIVWGADDANIQLYVYPFDATDAPLGVWEHGEQGLAPTFSAEHGVEEISADNETMLWTFRAATDGKVYRIHTVVDAPGTVEYAAEGAVRITDELQAYALPGRR